MRGYLDRITVSQIEKFERSLMGLLKTKYRHFLEEIKTKKQISSELDSQLKEFFNSEKFL
jgi:F0F1-type ATP synthase alpha subunit